MSERNVKCQRCHCYRTKEDFIKKDRILKTCLKCREDAKKYREKNKCLHGIQKCLCKLCGGNQICSHGQHKVYCKLCTNPSGVTIRLWIFHSRQADRKYNRYDADRFIDKCFLEGLIEDSAGVCYYCKAEVQYTEYSDDMATIERLDNSIGHVKSNCVIACRSCNLRHKD